MIPYKGMTKESENIHKYEMKLLVYKSELIYDVSKCIGCLFCIQTCPKEAIQRVTEKGVEFNKVDMNKCVMCGTCDYICPSGAFQLLIKGERKNLLVDNKSLPKLVVREIKGKKEPLRKFIEGNLIVDMKKWTKACKPCAEICPTECLTTTPAGKLEVNEELCIYCGNCERKAIELKKESLFHVIRKRILYEGTVDEFSAPWNDIVKKLVSFEEMAKELKGKAGLEAAARIKAQYKHLLK